MTPRDLVTTLWSWNIVTRGRRRGQSACRDLISVMQDCRTHCTMG